MIDIDDIATDNEAFMVRVLAVMDHYDCHDLLFWRLNRPATVRPVGAPLIKFFVKCSDTFAWATADVEEVTPDNLPELAKAFQDVEKLDPEEFYGYLGVSLFVARQRGIRVMPKMRIPELLKPLFDACGPERTSNDFLQ